MVFLITRSKVLMIWDVSETGRKLAGSDLLSPLCTGVTFLVLQCIAFYVAYRQIKCMYFSVKTQIGIKNLIDIFMYRPVKQLHLLILNALAVLDGSETYEL